MTNGDPALGRFALLQVARMAGALVALLGVVIISGRQPALVGISAITGCALIVLGAAEFFFVPVALAKRWKSRP
jgi:hypothetical protein